MRRQDERQDLWSNVRLLSTDYFNELLLQVTPSYSPRHYR